MLNSMMNYPYPVLRGTAVDYNKSTFSADIIKRDRSNGFELEVAYHTNNSEIKQMLQNHILAYALQIQCISTWYRKLEISENEYQKIFITSELVHEKVDLCPCIVALENVNHFENSDFSDDYHGISFELNKGDVVGIGNRQKFDAIYKNDIIKKGDPIVHFASDDNAEIMKCTFDSDILLITLPSNQYKQYNDICLNEPWKVPIVNAVFVVPVIVQAINEICLAEEHDVDTFSSYAWFKTLKVLIEKESKNDKNKYQNMLKEPITTAQKLLDDNSALALNRISEAVRQ